MCIFVLVVYLIAGEARWYAGRTGAIYLSKANTSHQQWQTFEVQICNTQQLAHHKHCASTCHRLKNCVKKAQIKICTIEINTNTSAIYFSEVNTYQQSQTFEHYAPICEDKYTVRQNKQMWENATRQWHPSILFSKHATEYFAIIPNAFINVPQSWTMTPVNPLGKHATVNSSDLFERITKLSLALSGNHTEFIKFTFTNLK